jgi:hypothetical protein
VRITTGAAASARRKIVGRLEVLGGNGIGRNEREYVNRLRGLDVGALEVLIGEDHVLVLLVFVALDDVAPCDFLAAVLAVALVADRRKVTLVEHRELEALAVLGGIDFDRNIHEAERDRTFPESARHDGGPVSWLNSVLPACRQGWGKRIPSGAEPQHRPLHDRNASRRAFASIRLFASASPALRCAVILARAFDANA